MPISHLLLTLLVVIIWGLNFIFVKLGLDEFSPLLLCAFRFLLASIPAVFFIKPPVGVPFRIIALYGLVMFALQFAFVFIGMNVGMTPGMASLIMQVQVFFSMFFAVFFLEERVGISQVFGALVAFSGIAVVAMHFDSDISSLGFIMLLAAAATWGVGNLITKKIKTTNAISVIVWGSFVACPPMFLLSLLFEGPQQILASLHHATFIGIGSLLYIVYASTWVGYGLWGWLIGKYPVSMVVPFTLLIPVVGMLASIVFLGEAYQLWKLVSGLLVICGLGINILSARLFVAKVQPTEA